MSLYETYKSLVMLETGKRHKLCIYLPKKKELRNLGNITKPLILYHNDEKPVPVFMLGIAFCQLCSYNFFCFLFVYVPLRSQCNVRKWLIMPKFMCVLKLMNQCNIKELFLCCSRSLGSIKLIIIHWTQTYFYSNYKNITTKIPSWH